LAEVNFWQPSGGRSFRAIAPGEPFFFKLKARWGHAIAGFGLFARHHRLLDWYAWETFGAANGAPDHAAMRRRIEKYLAKERHDPAGPYEIGCVMVAEPFFFAEDEWVPQPRDWRGQTVQGKTYDLEAGEGRRIWEACLERARAQRPAFVSEGDAPRFGSPQLVRPRLGQGTFRVAVTEAYDQACAVTTDHSLPGLEAAHIRPYADGGAHEVRNGLLLRTDLHRLFDKGYVTVTPEHLLEVSPRLADEWHNGKIYYAYHGGRVHVPPSAADRPDTELLRWHNEKVYRG
jgi:putative restriction endonuclease